MANRKWGESFLKSGLPLEHMIAMKLRSEDWHVSSNLEYARSSATETTWFEVDLFARHRDTNLDNELCLLIECKYHDTSRFWMFLPSAVNEGRVIETGDHQFLNCCPLNTLKEPMKARLIKLAPVSSVGVVLSEAGDKQDNAVHTAMQQISHAFVPILMPKLLNKADMILSAVDGLGIDNSVVVPMIITNAALYRLRPDVRELETIKRAASPEDIADKVNWTWCRREPSNATMNANREIISALDGDPWEEEAPWFRFQMRSFIAKPQWIAVVNADALDDVLAELETAFITTPMYSIAEAIERHRRIREEIAARSEARRKMEEEAQAIDLDAQASAYAEEAGGSQAPDEDDLPF